MSFGGGETCQVSPESTYNFTLLINCDSEGATDDPLKIVSIDSSNACNTIISVSHKNACPVVSVTAWTRFLMDRPYILSPLMIIFGLLVTFLGRKFFPWTVGIMGAVIGFFVTLSLFTVFAMLDSMTASDTDNYWFVVA